VVLLELETVKVLNRELYCNRDSMKWMLWGIPSWHRHALSYWESCCHGNVDTCEVLSVVDMVADKNNLLQSGHW